MDAPFAARVDHVGIAVENAVDAQPFFELLGCEKLEEGVAEGAFRWHYYALGDDSRLELIEPTDEESGFLRSFLDDRGPGLHHVTIEVDSLDAAVEYLEENGVPVVDRADRGDYAEAFVSPRNPTGALFQLTEYDAPFGETY